MQEMISRFIADEDCENINICKKYGQIYKKCVKGASFDARCSASEKMLIRILNSINDKLDKALD